jgi:hypothetical protein
LPDIDIACGPIDQILFDIKVLLFELTVRPVKYPLHEMLFEVKTLLLLDEESCNPGLCIPLIVFEVKELLPEEIKYSAPWLFCRLIIILEVIELLLEVSK